MKDLFSTQDTTALLQRLEKLSPEAKPLFGKMRVEQMLAHCAMFIELASGKKVIPRMWLGRIFSGLAKSTFLSEKPYPRGIPTNPRFRVTDDRDFAAEKERLTRLIVEFAEAGPEGVTHNPHFFFGKISPGEWSQGMYKHLDHHLSQFGV
ncbi:MAG TPA: DUF1569 domain-containing protein [Chitinophagaceae bacterium]|nr:DUF1569 domain-containing protein [Chitinophagaceae bacterium]